MAGGAARVASLALRYRSTTIRVVLAALP